MSVEWPGDTRPLWQRALCKRALAEAKPRVRSKGGRRRLYETGRTHTVATSLNARELESFDRLVGLHGFDSRSHMLRAMVLVVAEASDET